MSTPNVTDTTLPPINNLMLGALSQLNGALLDAVIDYQREAVGFFGKRLAADLKLQRDLMEVREISNLNKLQQEWLSTAMADYSAQSAKLLSLVTQTAKEEAESLVGAQSTFSKALVQQREVFAQPIAAE